MIHDYFTNVQNKIKAIQSLIKESKIEYRVVSPDMGIIKGKLIFIDNSILDFRELLGDNEHDYRFQWMQEDKTLISRWDTAPHHIELKNFPFHLHKIENEVRESKEIYLFDLIDYIKNIVLRKILEKIFKRNI